MAALVIDASVAARWFVEGEHAEAALAVLDAEAELIAPDLLVAELGNTLLKYVASGGLEAARAAPVLSAARTAMTRLVAMAELHDEALALALEIGHPIYDCYYLALARREKALFVTADLKLLRKLAGTPLSDLAAHLADRPDPGAAR